MKKLIILLILSVIIKLVYSNDLIPSIWPHPNEFKYGNTIRIVSSSLHFIATDGTINHDGSNTLNQAFQRYHNIIFKHNNNDHNDNNVINKVIVNVDSLVEFYPQLDTDESYTLNINDSNSIIINAPNIYGALRGLESMSQLINYDYDLGVYQIIGAPILVKDKPRYNHRGLLLDTSRHYQPLDYIKHTLDSLSYAKFNVFHWHVVDTQSFPFESKSYPKLWQGSYTANEKYSHEDIQEVVEYARLRGIKVLIEFDMPGHAASWCTGYPEICPSTSCLQPLDPSNPETFKLIDSLLAESTGRAEGKGMFPYEFLHLGGDEVDYSCWESSDHILAWEKENNLNGSEAVYEYFVDKAASIARDQKRTPIQWVEVYEHFGNKLSNDTVVHVWKEKSTMTNVILDGYRTILSDQDVWYLDHLTVPWESFYLNEPTEGLPTQANPNLILGGEACMWGETVDPSDIDNTIWPRAAAFAERMWTSKETIDTFSMTQVEERLEYFRCSVLTERSVAAAPVKNLQARQAPPKPGSCYVQRKN